MLRKYIAKSLFLCYYEIKEEKKGDAVFMRGEFYSANEYNSISEYKHFPAEMYVKPNEENKCGNEQAELGNEVTTLQKKQSDGKKKKSARAATDKLFESIRGITASGVVVASVVVTTVFSAAPEVELISLDYTDAYVEYQMDVSGLDESDYAIVLSTEGEEDVELELDGDGTYRHRVDGLKPDCEYTLAMVRYDTVIGPVSYFSTTFRTLKHNDQEPIPPPVPAPIPVVEIGNAEIVGLDEIKIYFTHDNLPEDSTVELDVLFGDMSADTLVLSSKDIERGYVIAAMDSSDTLTVTPTVTSGTEKTVCAAYTHTFTETFKVEAMVCFYDSTVNFYPIGITNGADYIRVTSSENPGSHEDIWIEGAAMMWYNTSDVITYTLYLTNDNGDVLSNTVELTVDTSIAVPDPQYNFVYYNPSDVTVTYNDDGTVNMYIPTQFESDDESVYYQITYGERRYISREAIARIEHIPDESYPLTYDVCVDIGGVQYSIYRVTPSGAANESWVYFTNELNGNTLTMSFDKELLYIDLNSVKLVSDNGEEMLLSEADFTYDDEYGEYLITVEFATAPEQVVISFMANPFYGDLESIDGYAGNVRKIFEETVYQP